MKVSRIVGTLAALFIYLVVVSTPAGEKKPAGDLAALQGKWKVWSDQEEYSVFEINDESFSMTRHTATGPGRTVKGSFTIDEETDPKQMTWKDVKGPGYRLDVNRCIYEMHGNTWLLIGGIEKRPKRFLSAGKPHTTWILKREKTAK